MPLGRWLGWLAALCALATTGCAQLTGHAATADAYRAECHQEVKVLVAHPTAANLATAAWLAAGELDAAQSFDLIERAEALAPQRPELVWIHLALCARRPCDTRAQLESRLQALDPNNGFAWIVDLPAAQAAGPDALTAAISRIGISARMTIYWNQLLVMMVDAMAVASPSENLDTRAVDAIGILAALPIPPLLPLSKACRSDLDLPGRRAACEAMVAREQSSSTVLTQMLALAIEER